MTRTSKGIEVVTSDWGIELRGNLLLLFFNIDVSSLRLMSGSIHSTEMSFVQRH